MSNSITLTIPVDMARLVADVVNRAADDGDAAFAADPSEFTIRKAEYDNLTAELRRFTALLAAQIDGRAVREAKRRVADWAVAEEGRSATADPVKHIVLFEPSMGLQVSYTFKRAEDGVYNGGNVARGLASAFVAAQQHAIKHGYTITEVRSDLPNARAFASMYEIPFAPLTPDDAPVT